MSEVLLSGRSRVAAIVERWPDSRAVLRRFGLDACCGGTLPLEEACRRHHLRVEEVLAALAPACPDRHSGRSDIDAVTSQGADATSVTRPGSNTGSDGPAANAARAQALGCADHAAVTAATPNDIHANATVRAVIAAYPETVSVFEKYGLMGCGGAAGPDEPIGFFARAHHVAVDELLEDLKRAIDEMAVPPVVMPTPPRVGTAVASDDRARRFVPFFIASLALTLTFGATLGMVNLARLTGTWGPLPRPSVWAHGYAQVFGFVGLFVMGVAYHVIPRFAGVPLQVSQSPVWSFWLQLGGVLSVVAGFMLSPADGYWLRVAGSAGLVAAATLFATSIRRTLQAGRPAPEPFERWVVAGALWLVLASVLALVAAVRDDPTWHHVLWPAALFGFAGSWIFGIGRRIFPIFLDWQTRWPRAEWPVFVCYQLGVMAWSLGCWPLPGAALITVTRALGAGLLIVAVAAFAAILGLSSGRVATHDGPDRSYERYIYAAWAWLFIGLATGQAWTLIALARGRYDSILMQDFARHAVAFGFITQMILGVASRVLPVFTGHALWSPLACTISFWLLNGAIAVRGLEAIVAFGVWPAAWPFIALSGPPAVTAMLLFAVNVVMTIRTGGQARHARSACTGELADRLVADVIQIPGALDLLVEAGFAPLRHPAMRRAFASTITLRQACRVKGVPLDPLVARLQHLARPQPVVHPHGCPAAPPAERAPVVFLRSRRGLSPADASNDRLLSERGTRAER